MKADLLDVLRSGMCSACGACVLTGAASELRLDDDGHLRPVPSPNPRQPERSLADYCPALRVDRPEAGPDVPVDRSFGSHLGVWIGHALDPQRRHDGSSGGALTALAAAALDMGEVGRVVAASGLPQGTRTQARMVTTVAELRGTASSRYAPVSTLAEFAAQGLRPQTASGIVGRPCEASAVRRLTAGDEEQTPLLLSFFCAGVPSQQATDALVESFGVVPEQARGLRYRGAGWPGRFSFTDAAGGSYGLSYDESWGQHLGRSVMPRCKVCVDGVGESADVVAGDIWESDEAGFPLFEEAPGQSVIIARTPRGLGLVEYAIDNGYLAADPMAIEAVGPAQPLQVTRRKYLAARLVGRRLAGQPVPRYRGFGLIALALADPVGSVRQARGSFQRARRERANRGE